ncbi:MAG: TolC family protein, partial [Bacteroidales bacterium]|nr:TolC family protein [Bacteroidales bacterium]
MKKLIMILTALLPVSLGAQQTLSLQDCRDLAVRSSKELDQAKIEREMAGYDRKIALANYFPNISATGTYMYNDRDIALISD